METTNVKASLTMDTSGFDRAMERVQKGFSSMKSGIQSAAKAGLKLAGIELGIEGVLKGMQSAEMSYLGLEKSVARIDALFGSSAGTIRTFGQTSQTQFGLAETDAYNYAQVYGSLFQGITKNADDNARATVNMLEATAVIASKTGLSTKEVIDRVSSSVQGNTSAMADLGIQTQASALVATDAFKTMADGRSWDQLSEKEQQQVRMLGILEQANDQFGTTVGKTSSYSLDSLGGAFDTLASYAGMFVNAGLMPIVDVLTDIVSWATDALKALGDFMGLSVDGPLGSGGSSGTQDYSNLTESWTNLQTALAPLSQSVGEGLAWLWNSVLVPLGEWTMNEALPLFLDVLAGALEAVGSVLAAAQPAFSVLWDNFLQPVAEWTGGKILEILGTLQQVYSDLAAVFTEKSDSVTNILSAVAEAFGFLWSRAEPNLNMIWNMAKTVFDNLGGAVGVIIDILNGLVEFISGVLTGNWAQAWEGIKAYAQGVWDGLTLGFKTLAGVFSVYIDNIVSSFRQSWGALVTWFNDTIVQPLGSLLSGLWETLKKTFGSLGSTVATAVGGALKSAVNAVIGFVEGTINNLIRGINAAIGLINLIPGVNIKTLSTLSIPRLAQGGVISRPTIAMIGEAGREAVLPLENNTGWMAEMARQLATAMGGPQLAAAGGDILIPVYLDGNLLDQVIVSAQERRKLRSNGR